MSRAVGSAENALAVRTGGSLKESIYGGKNNRGSTILHLSGKLYTKCSKVKICFQIRYSIIALKIFHSTTTKLFFK